MAHWCQVPPHVLWAPVHRQDARVGHGEHPRGDENQPGAPSSPRTQARPALPKDNQSPSVFSGQQWPPGQQSALEKTTSPETGFLHGSRAQNPAPAPSPPPKSFSLSRLGECPMDDVAWLAVQDRCPGESVWDPRAHQRPANLFLHLHCFLLRREQAKLGLKRSSQIKIAWTAPDLCCRKRD